MPYTIQEKLEWEVRQGTILARDTKQYLKQYKDPLMPVWEGYGYVGTVAFNEEQTHTQCHICGYFFRSLGVHIYKAHNMKVRDYKHRFSIMQKTSLIAANSATAKVLHAGPVASVEERVAILSQYWGKYKNQPETMEQKNIKGRCPEQLLAKILKLTDDLGKVPTRREFIVRYRDGGDLASIYRTFGSWNGAIKELGLQPNKKGRTPKSTTYSERRVASPS